MVPTEQINPFRWSDPATEKGKVSYINLIDHELQKAELMLNKVPESVGILRIKTANRVLKEAALRPDPIRLWDSLWYEGEYTINENSPIF